MLSRYSLYAIPFYTDAVDYVFSSTIYEFLSADANDPIPLTVISIPIIPDDINEFDETFKLTIVVSDEARASNVTEGEISMTVVLIKDDDSKIIAVQLTSNGTAIMLSMYTLAHLGR